MSENNQESFFVRRMDINSHEIFLSMQVVKIKYMKLVYYIDPYIKSDLYHDAIEILFSINSIQATILYST